MMTASHIPGWVREIEGEVPAVALPLTPTGRVSKPRTWQAALREVLKGSEFERSTVDTDKGNKRLATDEDRAVDFARQFPEAAGNLLEGMARAAVSEGQDVARHYLDLLDQYQEWEETPQTDPWEGWEPEAYSEPEPKGKSRKQTLPRIIEDYEAEAIFGAIDTRYPTQARNLALLRLLLDAGLRVGEACWLRFDAVKVRNRTAGVCEVRVPPEGKSGERIVPFKSAAFVLAWERWLVHRARWPESEYAFTTPNGTRVFEESIRRALHRYIRKAKLGKTVTPHMLRHTFGTKRAQVPGVSVADVAEWMGHRSQKTTMIYMHSSPERLRRIVESE